MIEFIKRELKKKAYKKLNIIITPDCKIDSNIIKNIGIRSKIQSSVTCIGKVEIGKYTSINGPSTQISSKLNRIKIGNFCSIASGVVIQEYYHQHNRVTSYYINRNIFGKKLTTDIYSKGDIIIEDDVWIGTKSVILSGVTIGRGSIIGAGSIVTKDIPKYSIVAGNPAKIIKTRFDEETITYLEKIKWWEWTEEKLKFHEDLFSLSPEDIKDYINKYNL